MLERRVKKFKDVGWNKRGEKKREKKKVIINN